MVHIEIVNICSCTELDNKLNPVNIKNIFNQLDEVIIVWCKAVNIKQDIQISMEWYNPDNMPVFKINVKVEATDEEHPFRYFWSMMKHKLLYAIEGKKFGKWTVNISPFGVKNEFVINELAVNYGDKLKLVSNTSFFDEIM